MSKIKVHAGDFLKGEGSFSSMFKTITLLTNQHSFAGEAIPISNLETVEIATEESVKRLGGTIGWGAVGGLLLGPLGLLAGVLVGGRGKEVTFIARFKDGRKLLATADSKTFTELQAAVF